MTTYPSHHHHHPHLKIYLSVAHKGCNPQARVKVNVVFKSTHIGQLLLKKSVLWIIKLDPPPPPPS